LYEEGKARIKYAGAAFLNPKAAVSRDISIAFVKSVAEKGAHLLDSTAATGIRGIRYYKEARIRDITLTEINEKAYRAMRRNLKFNGVKAKAFNKSIQEFANTCSENFDVIDLDPFGGVSPYIYDLMKISKDGTHMIATATDTAVLCGADSKACMRIYGAKPMHNELCHEAGLRILIGYIARTAAQFNLGVEPLMAVLRVHYMHVFLRIRHGSLKAMESLSKMGYAYYCDKCCFRTFERAFMATSKACPECGNALGVFGPMWMGSLYDKKTTHAVRELVNKSNADGGAASLMGRIDEELDVPFYYDLPRITRNMRMSSVSPMKVAGTLKTMGFEVSLTHIDPDAVRTTADLASVKRAINSAAERA
jgi:tRNA (guanine26-N2/guanine27-N2)-dimethyltransferase